MTLICARCGKPTTELYLSGWCAECDSLLDDPLPVKCSRCGKQHEHDRDCVEDSFDPRDHMDVPE